jgi:RNA polymerase sigma factor (sigma-70 family)
MDSLPLPTEDKQAFVAALVRDHGQRLRRYLAARLRNSTSDVPDLAQEVYLRMLRMPRHETIRSPQAYLFTVAHHVLYEHRMSEAAAPETVQMTDLLAEMESYVEEDPAALLETRQRLEQLDCALREISPRAYATFVLHRRYGFSLEEIGTHLGLSRGMVKKYLAKAVTHCRNRFDGMK